MGGNRPCDFENGSNQKKVRIMEVQIKGCFCKDLTRNSDGV